jgi:hypothetical protein
LSKQEDKKFDAVLKAMLRTAPEPHKTSTKSRRQKPKQKKEKKKPA